MLITREELVKAYFSCRRAKRYTYQAFKFELNYPVYLQQLYKELISDEYKPSPEVAFIIDKPKIREVFAAEFKDRIVHHIFINRIISATESYFSDASYNCRKFRGNINACKKLQEYMCGEDMWCLSLDIEAFFTSINREQAVHDIVRFIQVWIDEPLIESTIQLAEVILKNDVTDGCKLVSPKYKWNSLQKSKSLFNSTKGFPIGDITSQFTGNFILTYIDYVIQNKNLLLIRYADDFRIIGRKQELIDVKNLLFALMQTSLHLNFNRNKVTLQQVYKGTSFVGYFVKHDYLLPGKRLKRNAMISETPQNYLGFLSHCRSFKFKWKLIHTE